MFLLPEVEIDGTPVRLSLAASTTAAVVRMLASGRAAEKADWQQLLEADEVLARWAVARYSLEGENLLAEAARRLAAEQGMTLAKLEVAPATVETTGDFAQRLEQAKLDAMKELAYGAGHEINNPLANISARAQTLLLEERDPERRRALAAINAQSFRAHEMIADLMFFSRPPALNLDQVDLVLLATTVIGELIDDAVARGVTFAQENEVDALIITGDRQQLAVALKAICRNAIEASPAGAQVLVSVSSQTDNAGQAALIQVRDGGPGIAAEVRAHIFDPFFSGRESGRGLGFGLAKCWRIVELHHGRVDVRCQSAGTTILLRLPII